ncbi:MAG: hypothetical protein ACSLEY_02755 [Candidatus Saccharimonadales bacterium]
MKRVEAHYPLYETKTTRNIGLIIAISLLIVTLAQLFGFEDFYVTLAQFWGITLNSGATLAALIVVAEVFALPFLLGMKLSTAMRFLSAFLLLGVAVYWGVSALKSTYELDGVDTGLLGAEISVFGGIWLLLPVTLFFAGVMAYFAHVYIDSYHLHQHLRKNMK